RIQQTVRIRESQDRDPNCVLGCPAPPLASQRGSPPPTERALAVTRPRTSNEGGLAPDRMLAFKGLESALIQPFARSKGETVQRAAVILPFRRPATGKRIDPRIRWDACAREQDDPSNRTEAWNCSPPPCAPGLTRRLLGGRCRPRITLGTRSTPSRMS